MNRIIIFCGPPCSGKTTESMKLASALKIPRFSVDEICEKTYGNNTIVEDQRDIAYDLLHMIAENLITFGGTIVLDATYARVKQRKVVEHLSYKYGTVLEIHECRISSTEAVKRFLERKEHSAKDLDANRIEMLAKTYPYDWRPK